MTTKNSEASASSWRTVTNKIRSWFATGMFWGVIILAVVGAGSVLSSQLKSTGTYDDSAVLVAEAEDGTLYFVSEASLIFREEGYSAAKIIVGLDRDSVRYFKKMVEIKLCGKDPYDLWGIEQDTEFDFTKHRYRVVASRVVDYKGETIGFCKNVNTAWANMSTWPTPFGSVIDQIEQWQKEKDKA